MAPAFFLAAHILTRLTRSPPSQTEFLAMAATDVSKIFKRVFYLCLHIRRHVLPNPHASRRSACSLLPSLLWESARGFSEHLSFKELKPSR